MSTTPTSLIPLTRDDRHLVERAILIRTFESALLELFADGKLSGTVHTCVGQEFAAVSVGAALTDDDLVISNHRGHGHFLAVDDDLDGLMAEVMGRDGGLCHGVGGSQHLHSRRFLSSGIQGGLTPVAVGAALHGVLQRTDGIVAAFVGDGTLGEGLLYESFNIGSLWKAPVLFVVEDNRYAQSTPTSTTIAGDVRGRAQAFGMPYFAGNTWEWQALAAVAQEAVATVREGPQAAVLHIETYRLNPHSKGDDNRDPAEVAAYLDQDPLAQIMATGDPEIQEAVERARDRVELAIVSAEHSPACAYSPSQVVTNTSVEYAEARSFGGRHIDRIHTALRDALAADPRVVLLGEDIEGPYGGAFKATKDLSLEFPGRVRNTPISEAAIVGIGSGLALRGFIPVVEIMFGDFLTLTFDQIQQHAAKFRAMYGGDVDLPLIVRTPMGGRRGYGPTHSQSIEKHFLGIPGLRVVALNHRVDPAVMYGRLFQTISDPTLVIENKILYTRTLDDLGPPGFEVSVSNEAFPTVRVRPMSGDVDVTLLCYGQMLDEAERALYQLFEEHEILAEIVCPTSLYPTNLGPVLDSVRSTGALVVAEEGPDFAGFGSEIVAQIAQEGVAFRVARRGYNGVIPASAERERQLLVNASAITDMALEVLRG